MSDYLPRINGDGHSYGSFGYNTAPNNAGAKPSEEKQASTNIEQTPVKGSDVLAHMAQSAQYSTPVAKPKYDVPTYVTAEQAKDIAKFVTVDFENAVAENLSAIMAEFPNLSEDAQMALALEMVDFE